MAHEWVLSILLYINFKLVAIIVGEISMVMSLHPTYPTCGMNNIVVAGNITSHYCSSVAMPKI